MLPTPDTIRESESKARPLFIEPWVAAGFHRLWQTMKKNIQDSIVSDKQEQHRSDQSKPASSHSHS